MHGFTLQSFVHVCDLVELLLARGEYPLDQNERAEYSLLLNLQLEMRVIERGQLFLARRELERRVKLLDFRGRRKGFQAIALLLAQEKDFRVQRVGSPGALHYLCNLVKASRLRFVFGHLLAFHV